MAPSDRATSRYRRRILTIGAGGFALLFVGGAYFFNNRIETDLEARVPQAIADGGHGQVAAVFSGQDGVLSCDAPLDNPNAVSDIAYGVWGVRKIEIDRSCRVNAGDGAAHAATAEAAATPTATTATTPVTAPEKTTTTLAVKPGDPDLASISEVLASNPQFSVLSRGLSEGRFAVLASGVRGDVTFFAPSDAAFDKLPPSVAQRINEDSELMTKILRNHLVAGKVAAADLADGPTLTSVGGGSLDVAVGSPTSVGGAAITEPDIAASNGVVHAIDTLIVPDGVDLTPNEQTAKAAAIYDGAEVTLTGAVATDAERKALVDAAKTLAPGKVTDQLAVEPDVGLSADSATAMTKMLSALAGTTANAEVGFDGSGLYLNATYLDEAGRDTLQAVADTAGAQATLTERAAATDEAAQALEAELNNYVSSNPILFESGEGTLTPQATVVLDQLAALAKRAPAAHITIEGHTDSDGSDGFNRTLSQERADAVRDALVDRGVPAGLLTAAGFGAAQPVLVDGVEDKDASRRVIFTVSTSPA